MFFAFCHNSRDSLPVLKVILTNLIDSGLFIIEKNSATYADFSSVFCVNRAHWSTYQREYGKHCSWKKHQQTISKMIRFFCRLSYICLVYVVSVL